MALLSEQKRNEIAGGSNEKYHEIRLTDATWVDYNKDGGHR